MDNEKTINIILDFCKRHKRKYFRTYLDKNKINREYDLELNSHQIGYCVKKLVAQGKFKRASNRKWEIINR